MRRSTWATAILVVLLLGLLGLIAAYRFDTSRNGHQGTIVHEIRQMIATLQSPLEADPTPDWKQGRGLRWHAPPGVTALAALLALGLGVRAAAQQRSRKRRS